MTFTIYIIPVLVLALFIYAYLKKVNAYDSFIRGCKEGAKYVYEIMPYVISMIIATSVFKSSGVLESLAGWFKIASMVNLDLVNLMVFKPLSGMASMVILNDIFVSYGPDSFIGILASVISGSTDTTLYIITVYFGAVGIKNVRYSIKAGILTDLISFLFAFLVVTFLFF
jgi:spore maturation protein B